MQEEYELCFDSRISVNHANTLVFETKHKINNISKFIMIYYEKLY